MEPLLLLPLAAFGVLAVLFIRVVRRAGRFVARSREIDSFRSAVRDLDGRIGRSLDGAAARIDAVRRHQLASDAIGDTLAAANDAVARYTEEAAGLRTPPDGIEIREDILRELGRAGRALDMVEHGVTILASVRRGGRELEAHTAIKRGYLNLIHAREAIGRHASRVEDLEAESALLRSWSGPAHHGPQPDQRRQSRGPGDEVPDHTI